MNQSREGQKRRGRIITYKRYALIPPLSRNILLFQLLSRLFRRSLHGYLHLRINAALGIYVDVAGSLLLRSDLAF